MSDERVWLRHKETGHFWECPAGVVGDWAEMGWEPTDERPEEFNPVVATRLAWEADQRAAAEAVAKPKTSRKSGADTTPQEG